MKYVRIPKGETNYVVRIQHSPMYAQRHGVKAFQRSLGTPDPKVAQIRAAPYIMEHLAEVHHEKLMRSKTVVFGQDEWRYLPGKTWDDGPVRYRVTRDGAKIQVFDRESEEHLRDIDNQKIPRLVCPLPANELAEVETIKAILGPMWNRGVIPNGYLAGPDASPTIRKPHVEHLVYILDRDLPRHVRDGDNHPKLTTEDRSKLASAYEAPKTDRRPRRKEDEAKDLRMIEYWRTERGASRKTYNAVMLSYEKWQDFSQGAFFCTATRADAKAWADHLAKSGLLWTTYSKYPLWLSIVIRANRDGPDSMDANVFDDLCPKPQKFSVDGTFNVIRKGRSSYEAEEVRAIIGNLKIMPPDVQTLIMLVACTGMRCREVLTIDGEFTRRTPKGEAIRCIKILQRHAKTEASVRDLPLPTICYPYVPKKIVGPLFPGAPLYNRNELENFVTVRQTRAGRWIRQALRISGVAYDGDKSLYSFRHRAADMLKEQSVEPEMKRWILGHVRKTVEDEYGSGYPMHMLVEPMYAIWEEMETMICPTENRWNDTRQRLDDIGRSDFQGEQDGY